MVELIEVNGGQKSGSGTLLRISVSLASVLKEPLHIYNIRKKRRQSGLRPQHLEAVLTAAKLCNAEVKGASLGSEELWFKPKRVVGGMIEADIGTAGSIPMLLLTILPICAFAEEKVRVLVRNGGTDVRYSPTINYIRLVLLPTLEKMGLKSRVAVRRYGYYPKGGGEVYLEVEPCHQLQPITLNSFGKVEVIKGVSVCTFLEERKVAERQKIAASRLLETRGYRAEIEVINDRSNPLQKGSSITLYTHTTGGALLGGDAIGELRKRSEEVGREAAMNLLRELEAEATVDIHLADMLIPYMALAEGRSMFLTRSLTDHLEANIWLVQNILKRSFKINKRGRLYLIKKE